MTLPGAPKSVPQSVAPGLRNRFTLSLLQRVVLALGIVGLVPFVVSKYQIDTSRKALSSQIKAIHMVAARAQADRVAGFLTLHRSLGATIALHSDVSSDPASVAAAEALKAFVLARDDIVAAGLFQTTDEDTKLELIQLARRAQDKEIVDQALKPKDPEELAVTKLADQRTFMRFRVPFDEARLHLLLLTSAEQMLTDFVPVELGEEADLVLGDTTGQVVTGQLDSLAGFPTEFLKAAALLHSGADEFEIDGEEVLCAHADVPNSPWFVLSRQPLRKAEEAVATMRHAAQRAFAAVLIVVALLALAANTTIIKPIRRLAEAQRRLVGSAHTTSPGPGGEIAELESSFALLERHLHDREAMSKVFLGRYQVIDVLGAGAMGTVFRGWDPRLQRYVALKTVKLDDDDDERRSRLLGSLKKEAVTLARLQHAHIVTVFDILEQGSVAFIAMELIEGLTLEGYICQRTALPADQVIVLGVAVLKALAAAHEQSLVHHDIKPGNVLLGRDGKIKVTDFGIADLLSQAAKLKDVVVGTPGYLAPETLNGEGYTEKSDLFAAGVMLYESLTGKHPFQGTTVRQKVISTMRTPVPPPSILGFSVPRQFEMLILRLMNKDPIGRPADAASAAIELEELAAKLGCKWNVQFKSDGDEDENYVSRDNHLAGLDTTRLAE